MRLNGIVEINETEKLNVPIGAVFKVNLAVPHVYHVCRNRLGFTAGLRTIDTSKLLTNTVLPASFDESMIVSSFKFRAVVGIRAVDLTSTLIIIDLPAMFCNTDITFYIIETFARQRPPQSMNLALQ